VSEPRTHYQISLTARQAVGAFLSILLALGLAFFLGLMSGLSGRDRAAEESAEAGRIAAGEVRGPSGAEPSADSLPPVETGVPTAAAPSGALGSRTVLVPSGRTPLPLSADPTPPAILKPFEDGSADEASPIAEASGGGGPAAPRGADAKPGTGGAAPRSDGAEVSETFWVQVASLSSRDEASALSTRLTRHGFRSQVLTATGPKGRGKVYRVRVGPYRSEDDATRAALKLAKQESVKSPWVVPDGK
jgi:DedD protein